MANKKSIIDADYPVELKVLSLIACIAQEQKMDQTRRLKSTGLSITQLNLLHILSEGPKGGMTVNQLKELMVDDSPNVSRAVTKLVDVGFADKERSEHDQRVVYVSITGPGEQAHIDGDKDLMDISLGLTEQELEQLYTLLSKV